MAEPQWRIDELAQKAGVTVDTIRYYAREGLLPPPAKSGRNKLYGPEHVDRLARIAASEKRWDCRSRTRARRSTCSGP